MLKNDNDKHNKENTERLEYKIILLSEYLMFMKFIPRYIIMFEMIKINLLNVKCNFSSDKTFLNSLYSLFEWSISDGSSIIEWERLFLLTSKCKLSVEIS